MIGCDFVQRSSDTVFCIKGNVYVQFFWWQILLFMFLSISIASSCPFPSVLTSTSLFIAPSFWLSLFWSKVPRTKRWCLLLISPAAAASLGTTLRRSLGKLHVDNESGGTWSIHLWRATSVGETFILIGHCGRVN